MADAIAAADGDRLPWLSDEGKPKRASGRWLLWLLTFAGLVMVAVGAFVLGARSQLNWTGALGTGEPQGSDRIPIPAPRLPPVVLLPEAREAEPVMPQVQPSPAPAAVALPRQDDIRPALERTVPVRQAPRKVTRVQRSASADAGESEERSPAKTLQFSNPWDSSEASGRMVRIGTYSSLEQGKTAWSRLARVFPGIRKLPAVVTDIPSLRNGRTYYRLQMGTTSQAHSEVLCQRMRAIGQSCVVVDLAGARKGGGDDGQPVGI